MSESSDESSDESPDDDDDDGELGAFSIDEGEDDDTAREFEALDDDWFGVLEDDEDGVDDAATEFDALDDDEGDDTFEDILILNTDTNLHDLTISRVHDFSSFR